MSNRTFGVEIECYKPGEIDEVEQFFIDHNLRSWADMVGYDDSLSTDYENGVEIRTPVLRGAAGFAELKHVFGLLNENDFWVDETCGMHVHHGASEFVRDYDLRIKFAKSWCANEHLILNMVAPYRINNGYCDAWVNGSWGNKLEEYLEDVYEDVYEDDRGAFTFHSLDYHETIEIRLHEGTMNYSECESWILFGQKLIDGVVGRKNAMREITDEELLLKRLKVQKNASRFISRKVARNKGR